jgi:hypothetical protein
VKHRTNAGLNAAPALRFRAYHDIPIVKQTRRQTAHFGWIPEFENATIAVKVLQQSHRIKNTVPFAPM